MARDILLDEYDDLLIEGGDFVVDESTKQEVDLIIRTDQGDWRASPMTGFGVARRTRSEVNRTQFERDLNSQLVLDGFTNTQVSLAQNGQFTVNASRHE
jgi:hypothetical protein